MQSKQVICHGNKEIIGEIKRYAILGYTPGQIAKQLRLRTPDVALAISEFKRLGLLSPDKAKKDLEEVYNFQVTKVKNWTVEGLSIALKIFVNDLNNSKTADLKISNMRTKIRGIRTRLRDKTLIEPTRENLEYELEDLLDDMDWIKDEKRKVSSKDITALASGLAQLENVEKNTTGSTIINENTLILAGLNLKQARDIIANDPVMQEAVEAKFSRLDKGVDIENELMEGFDEFKGGGNI